MGQFNMKANELRIGNWYKDNEGSIAQVKSLDWFDNDSEDGYSILIDEEFDIRYCEGIPLTEEWFTKLGFKRSVLNGIYECYDGDNGIDIEKIDDGYYLSINCGEYIEGKPFHFVHQLQNLYFALTGEELTIQP